MHLKTRPLNPSKLRLKTLNQPDDLIMGRFPNALPAPTITHPIRHVEFALHATSTGISALNAEVAQCHRKTKPEPNQNRVVLATNAMTPIT